MARDTFEAQGSRRARHHGVSHKSAGSGRRLGRRLRPLCVVICCALALQSTLIAPARGRAASTQPAPSAATTARAGRSLLALVSAVGAGVRRLFPAHAEASGAAAAREAASAPEPAVFLIEAPSGLSVLETHDTRVVLSWPSVAGAVNYKVERSPNLLTPFVTVGYPTSNSFENTGLARGQTYLYRVRAVDGTGAQTAPGPESMATAIDFTDPDLVAGVTRVKVEHVNDLRLAIAGVRGAALLTTSWQETIGSGTPVMAAHVRELRDKLDEALAALGLPTPAYSDSQLQGSPNGTPIRKLHFEQLRERSTRGTGVTGSGFSSFDFPGARLNAANRTGGEGFDLYSRNFNWSLPVVGLAGRGGLDLGLSLSYNSLVWTRSGNYVLFDSDGGWPAPGFHLGFAVVQGKFYDTQAGKLAYLLVTSSGGRVSLRQTTTPGIYEAGDSSYLRLEEKSDRLELFTTDGTRMTFRVQGGAYKCEEVRDRNGNFITVAYTAAGNVDYVTDTLGRLLDFEYYQDGYLKQITQEWHREVESGVTIQTVTETHRWAKFDYDDVVARTNFSDPNSSGLTVFGPTGGQSFRALKRVTLADDASFVFNYNTWGQVTEVEGRAKDNGLLNRARLDLLADETQAQVDCPRPTGRRDWAAYVNGDTDGTPAAAEELVASCSVTDGATWTNPDDNQVQTGRLGQMTAPDGTLYKEYAHNSGWDKGLVRLAESWTGGVRKKWTSTAWTQDSEAVSYLLNPRVRETNVYDADGNRRRTEVLYTSFGLPQEVREYDKNASTVLRRTATTYLPASMNANGDYTLKRIIGLPASREVSGWDGSQERLYSKVTYEYDQELGCLTAAGAVAHHKTEYDDAGFTLRGNRCVARRWDVDNPSQAVATRTGYDTAGSVVFTRDAADHETQIEYAGGSLALAYPTKVTDPDGFYSTVEYNFDTGAIARAVDPKGAAVKLLYDAVGRRLKVRNEVNNAYTSWEYGASGLFVKTFTKVDTGYAETFAMSVTDGAGATIGTLRENPGEGTGYVASRIESDPVNRVVKQYRAAEVSIDANNKSNFLAWVPAGEDAAPQWPHTTTEYDWKGRPKRVVNLEGKDSLIEYGGCGCAGGEVVTVKGEEVPVSGLAGLKRRTQRVYNDIFGRPSRSEQLDWQGAVYSTTTTKYDVLDRTVRVRQYAGAAPEDEPVSEGSDYRTITMTYDGHGRLKEQHVPQQEAGRNTVYAYNADDTVESITDARGVKTTYGYNNSRHLVTSVGYDLTNVIADQNVQPAVGLTFTYDAAGNRTSMADGFGSVEYTYDTLSRLRSEKRTFSDPANVAVNGLVRELTYDYNLAGQLKSLTDPFGARVDYGYDKAGQLTDVTPGTPYPTGGTGGVPVVNVETYASGMKYRAWGALKGLNYGNGLSLSLTYTAATAPDEFKVSGASTLMWLKYSRYDDGMLKSLEDKLHHQSDRSYRYDHAGRLEEAFSGTQALSFVKPAPSNTVPYWQKYEYDVWGNTTKRENQYWTQEDTYTANFDTHNRRYNENGPLDAHDAEGNVVADLTATYTYDAAGLNLLAMDNTGSSVEQRRDGAGQIIKRRVERHDEDAQLLSVEVGYYVRSTVLGGMVVSELNESGGKIKSRVYAGGTELAELSPGWVAWRHEEATTGARGMSSRDGQFSDAGLLFDPSGVDLGDGPPLIIPSGEPEDGGGPGLATMLAGLPWGRCKVDGMRIDCMWAMELRAGSSAVQCPNNNCGPIPVIYKGRRDWASFRAYGDGYQGYVPHHAAYMGNGYFEPMGTYARSGRPTLKQPGSGHDTNFAELNGATGERLLGRNPEWQLRDMTAAEQETFMKEIKGIVEKPNCKKFLEGLFRALNTLQPQNPPIASSILEVFDIVDSQEGLMIVGNPEKLRDPKRGYYSTVAGSTYTGNASLLINTKGGVHTQDLLSAIHEAFHEAGLYTGDRAMAEAVFQYRKDEGLPLYGIHQLPSDPRDVWANSAYWDRYLSQACNPDLTRNQ